MAKQRPFQILRDRIDIALPAALDNAAQILHDKVVENASLTDHTLKDLARLGHPYSVRNYFNLHGAQVHKQSGDLVDAVYTEKDPKGLAVKVGIDVTKAPYVKYVIEGTQYMVPRDFISLSYRQVKPGIFKTIVYMFKQFRARRQERLKKAVRTDVGAFK